MKRKMRRSIAVGALIGIVIGVVLYFIFPDLLGGEVAYKAASREALGFSSDSYSVTGGSPYVASFLIPLSIGILGGFLGWVYSLINSSRR